MIEKPWLLEWGFLSWLVPLCLSGWHVRMYLLEDQEQERIDKIIQWIVLSAYGYVGMIIYENNYILKEMGKILSVWE